MKLIELEKLLTEYRKQRAFAVDKYIRLKIIKINNFFYDNGLDSAVVGISGGIDSAIVLALLHEASKQLNSPLKKILPLSLPIYNSEGVTGQSEASNKAFKLIYGLGYKFLEINLHDAHRAYVKVHLQISDSIVIGDKEKWAYGQLDSILRTPALYFHAAILQTQGFKSIVVGTTNRDEGSYIGFFGKASDGMVDLQPIADIHKSEVYEVAKYLNVPEEIINATPKGDVWDNRNDEEMIGAPYWFLESYLLGKEYGYNVNWDINRFSDEEIKQYSKWTNAIETLHNQNKHKYQVGSPAHFIDVMPRKIPGGWN